MQHFLILLIVLGCVFSLVRWQYGFWSIVVIGLIQDPLRKIIPESSGLYVMAIMPVWMMMLAGGLFSRQLIPHHFFATFPRLGRWILIFILYLIIPAMISATYGPGSWQITLLGLLIYSMVLMTLFAGASWPTDDKARVNFLAFYAIAGSVALAGGPMEHLMGSEGNPVLGTSALGATWVTHRTGAAVYMMSGFFRSPDIMGWHASVVFTISAILAVRSKGVSRYLWLALAIWSLTSMWVCGRRKIIAMIPFFAGYFLFLFYHFQTARRFISSIGLVIMTLGLGGYVISSYVWKTEVYDFYMTTFDEAGAQIKRHGFESAIKTIEQAGFWGYGLGMGQQGIHHIKVEKPRLWQESGPTKILAELGVPGTVLFLGIFVIMFITAHAVLKMRVSSPDFIVSAGIVALLISNLIAAIVSAQIYTDPFIAFLLASLSGMVLSSAKFRQT